MAANDTPTDRAVAVASVQPTSPTILQALAEVAAARSDIVLAGLVAGNPAAPPSVLDHLEQASARMATAVAEHTTDPARADRLAADRRVTVRAAAARNSHMTDRGAAALIAAGPHPLILATLPRHLRRDRPTIVNLAVAWFGPDCDWATITAEDAEAIHAVRFALAEDTIARLHPDAVAQALLCRLPGSQAWNHVDRDDVLRGLSPATVAAVLADNVANSAVNDYVFITVAQAARDAVDDTDPLTETLTGLLRQRLEAALATRDSAWLVEVAIDCGCNDLVAAHLQDIIDRGDAPPLLQAAAAMPATMTEDVTGPVRTAAASLTMEQASNLYLPNSAVLGIALDAIPDPTVRMALLDRNFMTAVASNVGLEDPANEAGIRKAFKKWAKVRVDADGVADPATMTDKSLQSNPAAVAARLDRDFHDNPAAVHWFLTSSPQIAWGNAYRCALVVG